MPIGRQTYRITEEIFLALQDLDGAKTIKLKGIRFELSIGLKRFIVDHSMFYYSIIYRIEDAKESKGINNGN
jgi:hypothetical protein